MEYVATGGKGGGAEGLEVSLESKLPLRGTTAEESKLGRRVRLGAGDSTGKLLTYPR